MVKQLSVLAYSGNRHAANIVSFPVYNLIGPCFDGHFRVFVREDTGKYLLVKFGGFGNLVSYVPVEGDLAFPTEEQDKILGERLKYTLSIAQDWHQFSEASVTIFDTKFWDEAELEQARRAAEMLMAS